MRIVFNLKDVGLGNNGGSRTLIKCAETLQQLGHEVILVSPSNRYSWHKISVKVQSAIPKKCDAIVATGFASVKSTVGHPAKRKFYYIRGFERWQASEEKLIKSYKSLNCIVNSEWLQGYFRKKKISCRLVYPGLDFDDFYIDPNIEREHSLGGLFSKKHKTKRHDDILQVGERVGCKPVLLNRDLVHPTPKQLRKFYSRIKIWMAPTELEGLHNCPMEASLCGCALVATDHARNGMHDYLDHTALIYPARDLDACTDYVEKLMRDEDFREELNGRMISLLKTKIGDRATNMKKMASILAGE